MLGKITESLGFCLIAATLSHAFTIGTTLLFVGTPTNVKTICGLSIDNFYLALKSALIILAFASPIIVIQNLIGAKNSWLIALLSAFIVPLVGAAIYVLYLIQSGGLGFSALNNICKYCQM